MMQQAITFIVGALITGIPSFLITEAIVAKRGLDFAIGFSVGWCILILIAWHIVITLIK